MQTKGLLAAYNIFILYREPKVYLRWKFSRPIKYANKEAKTRGKAMRRTATRAKRSW
jgi:hypothetical protein